MHRPAQLHRGDIVARQRPQRQRLRQACRRPAGRPDRSAGRDRLLERPSGSATPDRRRAGHGEHGRGFRRRLAEQFPGEASPHEIYDSGASPGDDFAEQRVAPGHLFLLGDNRDHSADSRFSRANGGWSRCRSADVRGVPLFFYWRRAADRIGDSVSH